MSFPRVLIAACAIFLLATTGTASASTHRYNGLPFAKTSFWNTPLPANPSIDPASSTLVSDLVGARVCAAARAHGVIIRPLGDVVVLMPPLSIEGAELQRLVSITRQAIEAATSQSLPLAA